MGIRKFRRPLHSPDYRVPSGNIQTITSTAGASTAALMTPIAKDTSIALITATFLAEPKATVGMTWGLFRGAGAIGGELLTGEPDVLNLEPGDATPEGVPDLEADANPSDTEQLPESDGERPVVNVDGDAIRQALDAGTETVIGLHGRVEEAQQAGGFTIEIGGGS